MSLPTFTLIHKVHSAFQMFQKFLRDDPDCPHQVDYPVDFKLNRLGQRIIKVPEIVSIYENGPEEICHIAKLPVWVTQSKLFNEFFRCLAS